MFTRNEQLKEKAKGNDKKCKGDGIGNRETREAEDEKARGKPGNISERELGYKSAIPGVGESREVESKALAVYSEKCFAFS